MSSRHTGREFGLWLDRTMENRRISNRELAQRVGVTDSVTSRWRSGQGKPSLESCERLADALEVPFLELAVTCGLLDSRTVGKDPLPIPPATALRERIRKELEGIRGLTSDSIEAALKQWDHEVGDNGNASH